MSRADQRPIIALLPLYVTTFVLQGGGGLLITLLTVRASREGFSPTSIGFIGTTYFIGFLLGTLTATRLIALVGHIRVFSAFAAIAAAGTLALGLYVEPFSWMAIRFVMGFCFSSLFTVLESWLNGAASNEARGRVLSIYGFVDLCAATGSQLLLPILGADGFDAIAVTAMLLTLSLVPIAITPTQSPAPVSLRSTVFWDVWRISPLAFVGCFVVGLTNSAFRTVGPLYAHQINLGIAGVAFFMSAGIAGGAGAAFGATTAAACIAFGFAGGVAAAVTWAGAAFTAGLARATRTGAGLRVFFDDALSSARVSSMRIVMLRVPAVAPPNTAPTRCLSPRFSEVTRLNPDMRV